MRRLVSLFVVFLAMSLTGWSQISYYVDGTIGSDANNGSQATPWQTITHAITQASSGDAINVAAGTYQEYVNVTKTLTLTGASAATVVIEGPSTGAQSVFLNANDIVFQGFTVTRAGNTPAAWATNSNNTGLQIAQLKTGCTVQNCIFTGNRNAIYLNNTQSHLIQNNIVDFNRTGVQLVNNVSGCTFTGNTITNNWTLGVVVYYNPNTLPATTNLTFSDNNISGNWYSQIEVKTISNFPTGTSYDFSKNYFGVADPRLTTTPAGEPGYDVQIPVMYGGTATAPSMTVGELTGDAISLADYSPWLAAVPGSSPMTWGTNDDIQTAIATAAAGDIINISAGTYNETGQIIISKNLSLNGAGESATIITPTSNTGSSGDARGWLLVQSGIAFNLSNVTLDGSGKNIYQAIRSYGTGTIGDVTIQNIVFPGYAGMGIVAFNNLVVDDVAMRNIGRVGISVHGTSATDVQIHGLDYTGKGIGDWLDYAVEFGGGGIGTVDGATISGCLGVASSDGSKSAGILATTYYGAGTTATVLNSTFTNNTTGVNVGYDMNDASTVTIHSNTFVNNASGAVSRSTGAANIVIDATKNYWGAATGPVHTSNPAGTGDEISDNVPYSPWLAAVPGSSPMTWGTNDDITATISAAASGDIIQIASGAYSGNITVNKPLTLTSTAPSGSDPLAPVITGLITVASDGVTIKSLKITNPSGNAMHSEGWGSLSIIDNLFEAVGTTANTNVHAITFLGSSTGSTAVLDDVNIDGNVFTNIGNPSSTYSNSAITVGFSDYSFELTDLIIQNNTISDINSNDNATTGKGAYGILLNVGSGTGSGKVTAPIIRNNIISDLVGRWAHAIGLEADTENALVENNEISAIVSTNSTPDASAVFIEKNHYTNSLAIRGNRFGTDVTYGVALHPDYFNPSASDLTWYNMNVSVDAAANYWGDNDGPCAPADHANCSGYGVMVVPDVVFAPWTGQTTVVPAATIPNATMDIGDDDVTEIELEYVAVPESGGTISISTYDTAPTGITPPVANVSKYIDISSDMPNGSFGMWITLTVTAGSATGNFLEIPADTADNRLAYFNETSGSWVLVNGFYSVMPASTGGVFDNASGSAAFTFFTDHFTVFAFIGGSSASYYNTPASAYPLYIAKAPIAGLNDAANRTVYPNSTWSGGYPGRTDDWGFSGTQPVTVYVVPDNDASFSFGSVTLQWVNGMLGSSVAVNGSDGTYSGLFTGANRTLNSEMLGTTNTIRIHATRLDVTNYGPTVPDEPIATGDFMVKLGFTLLKPGSTGIDVIGADFRRYVTAAASQQYVYVEPLGTSIKAYLGDVANSTDQSSGDGAIDQADLAIWSNSYWSGVPGFAGGLTNYKAKFDIGPTTDGTPFSLPVPDTKIEFEDLVIFSISYGLSASNALPKGGTDPGSLSLAIGDAVEFGNEIRIPVRMHAGTDDVRALKLRFDGIEGKFLGIEKGTLLQEREESIPVFALQNGSALAVDLAVMGADAKPLDGSGDLVWLRFNASTDVRFTDAEARNSLNRGIRVALNAATATGFALEQNYPNPFNPSTTIGFTLESDATIELSVHNTLGQKVATIYHGTAFAGTQQATWNGTDDAGRALPSGVYIYRLSDGTTTLQRAMMLAK